MPPAALQAGRHGDNPLRYLGELDDRDESCDESVTCCSLVLCKGDVESLCRFRRSSARSRFQTCQTAAQARSTTRPCEGSAMRVLSSTALRRPLLLGILSAASVGRHRPCRLQIFPGDAVPTAAVAPPSGDFDGANPPAVTGFWTIYDDVAMEDSMNRAARQEPEGPNSMMSASIVLRADGFTSRGSEFTRGTWRVEEQGARRRLLITLEARALQEEIRYDGLLVKLDTAETGMAQALAAALPKGSAPQDEEIPKTELRVVGQASRYRLGGEGFEEGGEPELMKTTAFSMIKLEVT